MFKPVLAALYEGDNGATHCGAHLGYTASTTGRDISGHKIRRLTKRDIDETRTVLSLTFGRQWTEPLCETCCAMARKAARDLVTA